MRVAYFDCFSGVAGNMILGALLAAGASEGALREALAQLGVEGYSLTVRDERRHGLAGKHVEVTVHDPQPERHLSDIEAILTASRLPGRVTERALAIFRRLAQAEASVHGVSPDEVHFHEVGALDAIVDVVGAVCLLDDLGVEAVEASAIHVGAGWVRSAHGILPVPAPATAELLRGIPSYALETHGEPPGELATPTGVAILATLARRFGPWPAMRPLASGYGLGTRPLPWANALRVTIGEALAEDSPESSAASSRWPTVQPAAAWPSEAIPAPAPATEVDVVETQLDDASGELCGEVLAAVMAAGALDAYLTPILMKKGRPGHLLTVLTAPEATEACCALLLRQSTALGVRVHRVQRSVLERGWVNVTCFGHPVRVKLAGRNGEVWNVAPEAEDCRRVAAATGRSWKEVYGQALGLAWTRLNGVEA